MSPRWNWDFEDEQRAASVSNAAEAGTEQGERRGQIRRRRLGAAVAAVVLLAAAAAVLAGSHHGGAPSSAAARPRAARRGPPPAPRPDERQRGESAVAAVLAYTPFVREGGAHGRDVALTFDDGPGPYTPGVLDALERAHASATFFAIGEQERYFSASTTREIRDGDVVGDHTETHPEMARLSEHDQHEELFEQIARVELLGGPRPRLFRPPYGSFNPTTFRVLHRMHLLMVLWSVDTGDYLRPGVPAIVERVLAGAQPGAIFLLHDGGGDRSQTIAALPLLIAKLRARGYRLVTVPELLADDPPPRGQPLPTSLAGD